MYKKDSNLDDKTQVNQLKINDVCSDPTSYEDCERMNTESEQTRY